MIFALHFNNIPFFLVLVVWDYVIPVCNKLSVNDYSTGRRQARAMHAVGKRLIVLPIVDFIDPLGVAIPNWEFPIR